jgi:excisionase family DNA binding protein
MQMLSVTDVCNRLALSRPTVGRMVKRGELPAIKVGRRVLFAADKLDAWLDARYARRAVEVASEGTPQ